MLDPATSRLGARVRVAGAPGVGVPRMTGPRDESSGFRRKAGAVASTAAPASSRSFAAPYSTSATKRSIISPNASGLL